MGEYNRPQGQDEKNEKKAPGQQGSQKQGQGGYGKEAVKNKENPKRNDENFTEEEEEGGNVTEIEKKDQSRKTA